MTYMCTRGLVHKIFAFCGGSLSLACALSQSRSPSIDHPKEIGPTYLARALHWITPAEEDPTHPL